MAEVIRRLKKDRLAPKEFKYITDIFQYENMVLSRDQIIDKKDQIIDKKDQIIDKKDQIIDKMQAERLEIINKLWKRGNDIISIADVMGLSADEVKAIIQKMQ